MPNIVHTNGVEHLQVQSLRGILKRRFFRGIILEGGSPCQGNSILNASRNGLKDQRSQQHARLERLLHDLEQEPLVRGLVVAAFLENVASMPNQVKMQYNKWLRSTPVLINAATCG